MSSISLDPLKKTSTQLLRQLNTYRAFVFFLIVALLYGFIIWRINTLATASPTEYALASAKRQTKAIRLDEDIITKIQNLKDNSVSVQTLFENARNNPFTE